MTRRIIAIAFFIANVVCVPAQIVPQANDFTVAVTLGYNSFTTVEAQSGFLEEYTAVAPNINWMTRKLMTGVEFGWFALHNLKLTIGGGFNYSETPGRDEIHGIDSYDYGIPTYSSVDQVRTICYEGRLVLDYYLNTGVENLKLFFGPHGVFSHCIDEKKHMSVDAMGKSLAEAYTIKGAINFGADYFIARGFYVGAQVDFGSYTYGLVSYKPQEGLSTLKADNHNFSFLSAPTLKVGFKF